MAAKTVARALSNITKTTNAQFWDMARRFSPDFKSHTAKATEVEFSEKGFEAIKLTGLGTLNEFYQISMRIAFQMLNVATAKNPLSDAGLVQVYDTPNGGYVQRISVNSVKPISPAYKGLQNGKSVDPFVVRKPEIAERFFQMNFDYQSMITLQEYQLKTMFISQYGMGETLAGILQGLANGYTIQEYLNTKECINASLHSENYPLKDSQVLSLDSWTGAGTDDELRDFVLAIKNTVTRMNTVPVTGMYNAMGFESSVDTSDMVLVMRAGIKDQIAVKTMVGAFNPEYLSIPVNTVEVDNFGGIEHYKEAAFTTKLYPVYDELGTQIGWNEAEGQTEVTVQNGAEFKKDTNEEVLAILVQKGAYFENAQNGYEVTPIYNPRGLYTNYWANRPNNGINWDPLYNMVVFRKPGA